MNYDDWLEEPYQRFYADNTPEFDDLDSQGFVEQAVEDLISKRPEEVCCEEDYTNFIDEHFEEVYNAAVELYKESKGDPDC